MSESRPAPAVRNYLIDGLVLAGAGVALLSWFGRFHWTFDLLSHFRLQEAVVVWLLAVLAWVSERRFVAVLATGVFLLQANSLRAIWSHPLVIPMGQPRLKCVYANLHSDNVDFAAILEWIDQEQPDVIALLEYSAAWD
ncbi:MAG TPA: hypothetical protein P5218_09515, partial [Planctomycetota bacterium]|nr:hypothetical protein [Planctomycetota bacterium]